MLRILFSTYNVLIVRLNGVCVFLTSERHFIRYQRETVFTLEVLEFYYDIWYVERT